jgi:hypothetical protein
MKDLPPVPKPRQDPDMDNFVYEGKQGRPGPRRNVTSNTRERDGSHEPDSSRGDRDGVERSDRGR